MKGLAPGVCLPIGPSAATALGLRLADALARVAEGLASD